MTKDFSKNGSTLAAQADLPEQVAKKQQKVEALGRAKNARHAASKGNSPIHSDSTTGTRSKTKGKPNFGLTSAMSSEMQVVVAELLTPQGKSDFQRAVQKLQRLGDHPFWGQILPPQKLGDEELLKAIAVIPALHDELISMWAQIPAAIDVLERCRKDVEAGDDVISSTEPVAKARHPGVSAQDLARVEESVEWLIRKTMAGTEVCTRAMEAVTQLLCDDGGQT